MDLLEPGFKELNRYKDILPYKYNSIKISTNSQYINASPINIGDKKNLFIATQGPIPQTIEDFWTIIWELNSKVIVMLCNLFENNKKKCENYWETEMKQFKVKVKKEIKNDIYYIREIQLINLLNKEERNITQIHYMNWPDHGVPDNNKLKIFSEINELVDKFNSNNMPIIVHCSAGVGRTGTFIAMYLLEKEILKQIEDKCPIIRIIVFNIVRKLKEMRMYMVQTLEQYKLIYSFVEYLLEDKKN